jgi:acetyl-CoA carboxylase biotin carboxyl carrier protein
MSKLPDQDLEALISEFERSSWREMHLRLNDVELILTKDAAPVQRTIARGAARPSATRTATAPLGSSPAAPAAPEKVERSVPAGWTLVKAPTLGTFYRSPKPGAPAFIRVGDEVASGTEVCLVEVMKLFTTVRAGVSGIVREVYPQDGDLVEFEQALFLVEPRV